MKYLSDEINNRIISIVEKNFNVVLASNVERFIDFFNTLLEHRESFPDYDENTMILNTENAQALCNNINSQIGIHFQKNENLEFEILFPDLVNQIDSLLLRLDPLIKIEQTEERFKLSDHDKKIIGLAKRIKILVFKTQQISKKIINPVLKLSKQKPFEIKYWDQKIPLRNFAFHYLRNRLLKKLSDVYEDVFKILSEKSILFWNYDESYDEDYISRFISGNNSRKVKSPVINPETIISDLEKLNDEIKKKSLSAIEQCFEEFDENYQKVGTIELSKSGFNSSRITKQLNTEKNEFTKCIKGWENTLFALGEDWALNYDLELTRYSVIDVFYKFAKSLSVKNKIKIYPEFKEISGTLNFVIDKLNQPAINIQDMERLIILSKESLHRILLSSLLPNLINSISDIRLEGMINEARRTIKNHIRSLAEKRAFVNTTTYDKKIKSSDIDEIYPREFISFNTLPKFLSSLEKIKKNISVESKNIQSELINLGNIADFSLESAIAAAAKENLSLSDIKGISLDGIKVSQDKKEQLLNSFNSLCENVLEDFKHSVAEYCEELYSLTESSKIIEIRVQLAKAKAKAKVKETRERLLSSIRNILPVAFEKIKVFNKTAFRFYYDTKKQFGLTESSETIDSEISDFLSSAKSSLEKLPYIYRRLFQLSPLENDRLYIVREFEESQLQLAYTSWQSGRYAPVIVSAEKGGGITSFLNICLEKIGNKTKIKRLRIKPSVYDQEDILKILTEIFLPKKFLDIEDLINFLNVEENKQIIVIENLQHMYLRSMKGFLCLKTLIDIISKTNKNIFWITSTTIYANKFLDDTIRLNDIFGYHIILRPLKSDQIIDLVKKRNAISGYNLEYVFDSNLPRKKEFNNLSNEQKQSLLENEFFHSLNKFAQSNVSLALLFWLRSISEIQERKVFINAAFVISDTILNSLSSEKIFVLQSLVLHDGLRVSDLAKTINYSFDETNQLTQILYDDGVLVKNEDVFLINPLLYRQTVLLLKLRNLI
jgi:hypothetical protein